MKLICSTVLLLVILNSVSCEESSGRSGDGDDTASEVPCTEVFLIPTVVGAFIAGMLVGSVATVIVGTCIKKMLTKKQSELELSVLRSESVSDQSLPVKYRKKMKKCDGNTPSDLFDSEREVSWASTGLNHNSSATLPSKMSVVQQKSKIRRSFSLDQAQFDIPNLDEMLKQKSDETNDSAAEHYYECEVNKGKQINADTRQQQHPMKSSTLEPDRKLESPKYYNVGFKVKGGKRYVYNYVSLQVAGH